MRIFTLLTSLAVVCAQPPLPLTLQPCSSTAAPEKFTVNSDLTISAPGGLCVDTDGSTVSAAPCKGTQDLSQKWNWLANGCVSSVGDPSLCWNADSGSTAPGTPIIMYQCGVRPSPAVAQNDLFYFDPRFEHIVGNESALCFSTETIPPGPPPPCSDDTGCSLNGVCTQSTGMCTCYPPWTGGDCSELDILPAPPVRGYGMDPDIYTWGGSVVLLDDGLYHMYVAEMSGNCSLNSWGSHSLVTHATAATPEGPFVRQDTALPVWSHNPQVVVQKNASGGNATLVLFHIGDANNGPVSNCSAEVSAADGAARAAAATGAGSVGSTLHYATNPYGPWTPVVPPPPGCNNPAPFLHPNGTWYLFCSGPLYSAPSFFGPWTVAATPSPRNPGVPGSYEDPVLYVDPRGNWHIIWHVYTTSPVPPTCVNSTVSGHWFSPDGLQWYAASTPPFPNTIPLTDGTTTLVSTRERPKILFDAAGDPTHLYNGVCATLSCAPTPCVNCKYNGKTYTNAVPLNTPGASAMHTRG